MKVFDLLCPQDHVFEAWFGSEDDFRNQAQRGLVQCPLCGSTTLRKGLSAPRLNLGAKPPSSRSSSKTPSAQQTPVDAQKLRALQAAWLAASRTIADNTEDVGDQFAEKALRMHQGDAPERPIRGQATAQQTMELLEEGVPLMPLALPAASKETLQ